MSDLRTPIGLFFTLIGLILLATGAFANDRAPLETVNLNLYSGVSMMLFGGAMLWLARRSS
jgi:hypothetical protein